MGQQADITPGRWHSPGHSMAAAVTMEVPCDAGSRVSAACLTGCQFARESARRDEGHLHAPERPCYPLVLRRRGDQDGRPEGAVRRQDRRDTRFSRIDAGTRAVPDGRARTRRSSGRSKQIRTRAPTRGGKFYAAPVLIPFAGCAKAKRCVSCG